MKISTAGTKTLKFVFKDYHERHLIIVTLLLIMLSNVSVIIIFVHKENAVKHFG